MQCDIGHGSCHSESIPDVVLVEEDNISGEETDSDDENMSFTEMQSPPQPETE